MGTLRIGELARRTSLSPEVLRAWERRYGLLQPTRTAAGYRLYSDEDAARVARMQQLLAGGIAAAEAARLALDDAPAPGGGRDPIEPLRAALDAILGEVVLPLLRELGERWERGEASVAQEHFASQFLRGRLLGLARGWDRGFGPRAVLACAPGEQHDLPLVVFGLALREEGWRITFLGADTPVATLASTAEALDPTAIVVSATREETLAAVAEALAAATRRLPLWVGGAGATEELAARAGARLLAAGPLEEAARLAAA